MDTLTFDELASVNGGQVVVGMFDQLGRPRSCEEARGRLETAKADRANPSSPPLGIPVLGALSSLNHRVIENRAQAQVDALCK